MAESSSISPESRPAVASSMSYSVSSTSALVRASLKRSITTDLDFLSTAADSFNPKPYTPTRAGCSTAPNARLRYNQRTNSRSSIAAPPLALDVTEKDPDAVFIHPPFTTFPGSTFHREGLTFALMAENLNWFLDPKDYFALEGSPSSTDAIPYPPSLEPPRGWCPAKRKEIREKGAEGWAEGEEPKLRCTFCRRAYAGVNAKSMWRRHVFEKHKVAMSNRREGNDRPRGRGSMKENRRPRDREHDSVIGIDVTPQTDGFTTTHRSRFQGVSNVRSRTEGNARELAETSSSSQQELAFTSDDSISPPSTPPPVHLKPSLPISCSPYDPNLTPAFRHSSPKLPSDQPWRFPSPAHPLYSKQRQLSLSMLVHEIRSPAIKARPHKLPNSSSPLKTSIPASSSPILSPPSSPQFLTTQQPRWEQADTFTGAPDDNDIPARWVSSVLRTPGKNPFPLIYDVESSPLKGDSPILRSRRAPPATGGLLEPFRLTTTSLRESVTWDDDDLDDEVEVVDSLTSSPKFVTDFSTPPPKRRKIDNCSS